MGAGASVRRPSAPAPSRVRVRAKHNGTSRWSTAPPQEQEEPDSSSNNNSSTSTSSSGAAGDASTQVVAFVSDKGGDDNSPLACRSGQLNLKTAAGTRDTDGDRADSELGRAAPVAAAAAAATTCAAAANAPPRATVLASDAGDLEPQDVDTDDDYDDGGDVGGGGALRQQAAVGSTAPVARQQTAAAPVASSALPPLSRRPTSPRTFQGGILEVVILGAENVKQMDLMSKSDAYVVVTFGLEQVRTSVKQDVDACTWGQDGEGEWAWFFVPSTATERLEMRLSLWDEDKPPDDPVALAAAKRKGAKQMYNRYKATSEEDDHIGTAVVQVEGIGRNARLVKRTVSYSAEDMNRREVDVRNTKGEVTGTVFYRVRMLERRQEISGTFWRTLLRVVDCDGDASTVSVEDATALLEFLEAAERPREAVLRRMFPGLGLAWQARQRTRTRSQGLSGCTLEGASAGAGGSGDGGVDAGDGGDQDRGRVEAGGHGAREVDEGGAESNRGNSSAAAASGDSGAGSSDEVDDAATATAAAATGGSGCDGDGDGTDADADAEAAGDDTAAPIPIPAAVQALVDVSASFDLVSARFPADIVTGRSLAGLTPFEKECYLLQSLDHGNCNRMTDVAISKAEHRLHNSWMAVLANDWSPPENTQHSFVSSRQVRNRATGMMEDEYISSMVWLSLKAIYSKLFLEGISGLLDLMTAKMSKQARDPKQAKELIHHFVEQYSINLDEVRDPVESFQTLNDFFVRRLKPGARPVASPHNPRVLTSAADCRLVTFSSLSAATRAWVKGNRFSVAALLGGDEALAAKFLGGAMTIFRLAPQDYHCFHFPCAGRLVSSVPLPGKLYSVNPIVVQHERVNVFTENVRCVNVLESPEFGTVVLVAVGATIIGSIRNLVQPGQTVSKGQLFGDFQYGGSTVIMLTQQGRVEFDHDLLSCAEVDNAETYVRMGERIGVAPELPLMS